MTDICLIVLGIVTTITVFTLAWLIHAHVKLKRDYSRLFEAVQRSNNDIAGICAAAVKVDDRIDLNTQYFIELQDKISGLQLNTTQADHAYRGDIQKVRSGVGINELMQSSGISHDEAALLIRLHGGKTSL